MFSGLGRRLPPVIPALCDAIFAAMSVLFLLGVLVTYWAEAAGNPRLAELGVDGLSRDPAWRDRPVAASAPDDPDQPARVDAQLPAHLRGQLLGGVGDAGALVVGHLGGDHQRALVGEPDRLNPADALLPQAADAEGEAFDDVGVHRPPPSSLARRSCHSIQEWQSLASLASMGRSLALKLVASCQVFWSSW